MPKLKASKTLTPSEARQAATPTALSGNTRANVRIDVRTDVRVNAHTAVNANLRIAVRALTLVALAAILASSLAGCGKNKKQVGSGRGALQISNSEFVLDPRFSVFLSKAYFAVASRREATSRIKLIKKGRLAERGASVDPEEVKRGRRLNASDLAWLREQRQKLTSLLSTVSGNNTSMFATAALAQANFDCWYFEMYKSPLVSRNSACGLDLAAALGSAREGGLAQAGLFPQRENVPRIVGGGSGLSLGSANRQGFATGQQFSTLERYLEKSDIDTLLMFLREGEADMRVVVEKLVEQQLGRTDEGIPLPVWQIIFKGKKSKLNKATKKTVKRIANWYKEQVGGLSLRIEGSKLDSERIARVVAALVKKGVAESDIVRGGIAQSAQEDSPAGEISISAQRSAK